MKSFYDGLKAVYGPRDNGSIPVRSRDGTTLITDRSGILSRWAEHFHGVLNQPTTFDASVRSELPVWDTDDRSLKTKIAIYRAVVLTSLLYGCETWTLYRRSIRKQILYCIVLYRPIANVRLYKQCLECYIYRLSTLDTMQKIEVWEWVVI